MTNYIYTDWMSQFSETDRQEYVEIAKKGFQNLTPEEEAFLETWNNAKAVFDAEITESLAEMRSAGAIATANSITARTTAILNIQTLEQAAIDAYEDSLGGDDDGE